ncbi:hypothetical protein T12_8562 [Trichinella patagoniensis]|uniref:Uncharacterized protein n=1 Tax=Trichinella patagoniensis TaxID=990121 RepID=A0A0V0Z6E7_9BILA|nr:hypothetical protein T12_8562 [Trichinella patagoniensis]
MSEQPSTQRVASSKIEKWERVKSAYSFSSIRNLENWIWSHEADATELYKNDVRMEPCINFQRIIIAITLPSGLHKYSSHSVALCLFSLFVETMTTSLKLAGIVGVYERKQILKVKMLLLISRLELISSNEKNKFIKIYGTGLAFEI